MIRRAIAFYNSDFTLIESVPITKPMPSCWQPSDKLDAARAIQAVSNGTVIGLASKVGATWHYNLVGGNGHLPPLGASHQEAIKEIVAFFCEAMLLSPAE